MTVVSEFDGMTTYVADGDDEVSAAKNLELCKLMVPGHECLTHRDTGRTLVYYGTCIGDDSKKVEPALLQALCAGLGLNAAEVLGSAQKIEGGDE
ncbi:MAG: hypothetical protein JSS66_06120 [Armatimonadetes bacterium]|nr:hypothetical protein [Armatimonadota bacterium]